MTLGIATSVRQRLGNIARQRKIDYNRLLLLYLQERWLARLSESVHRETLILKGGLALYSVFQLDSRPTRDIDFLGRVISHEINTVVQIVKEVSDIQLEDGVIFYTDDITGESTREGMPHGGTRVNVDARLGSARTRIRIDIGFGDGLVDGPIDIDYPTLLKNENPSLLAYSIETIIAEKIQAASVLLDINSRYKDFYDIHQLAVSKTIDSKTLQRAIVFTFNNRKTPVMDINNLFQPGFIQLKRHQEQWNALLRKMNVREPNDFSEVMKLIKQFIEPLTGSFGPAVWNPEKAQWLKV